MEKETSQTRKELFDMLSDKVKPQQNETILLLQYRELLRHSDESAEYWMDRLRVKAT